MLLIVHLVTMEMHVLKLMFVFLVAVLVPIHSHVPVMYVIEENVLIAKVLQPVQLLSLKTLAVIPLVVTILSVQQELVLLLLIETVMLEIPILVPEGSALLMVLVVRRISLVLVKMVILVLQLLVS